MKYAVNLDGLKVCYLKNEVLFDRLVKARTLFFEGFFVKVVKIEEFDGDLDVTATMQFDGTDWSFATLVMKSRNKYCFICVQNRTFYEALTAVKSALGFYMEKKSLVACLNMVSNAMNLQFNNVTYLDVCIDVDTAAISRIRKAIRDIESLDLFINGKKVADDEILPILTVYGTTRKSLNNQPTLYFAQKANDLTLKVYHKGNELIEQSKEKEEYTREWNGIQGKQLQRLEVKLRKDKIREFCRIHEMNEKDFLDAIISEEMVRVRLFWEMSLRLIFFKTKKVSVQKKGEKIDLLSVVSGKY